MEAPRLRAVRVVSSQHDGTLGVLLSDPLGIANGPQFLPLSTWNIARRFDGTTPCAEIARVVNSAIGTQLASEDVRAVATELSRCRLLDDAEFERALTVELDRFHERPTRRPVGPGRDYPANATELRIRVAGLVANDWDMPPVPHAFGMIGPAGSLDDFAPLYARSWAAIRHARPDRVIVLAAAGTPLERPLVPLDRPLETPFGDVPLDEQALAALAILPGRDLLAHKDALVLERQALFTRLLFRDVPMLGLLVGAVPAELAQAAGASQAFEALESTHAALDRLSELPGRTLFVCAADLLHAGSRSASPLELDGQTAGVVRTRDRDCLDAAARLDAEGYWEAALGDSDPERAAWSLAPYLFLSLGSRCRLPADAPPPASSVTAPDDRWRGSTLGYHQVHDNHRLASAASLVVH